MKIYKRELNQDDESFFLFGMRGSGKSYWAKTQYPHAIYIDFLDEGLFQDYTRDPRAFALFLNSIPAASWVVIDEIQRIPNLLNEVHRAIENKNIKFVLTGSSARKLRHAGVNLLAGRALKKTMYPLTPWELGEDFDIERILQFGSLPIIWNSKQPKAKLKAYAQLFLKEEIQSEALVRNLAGFSRFLPLAALFNAQILNKTALARDAGIGRTTIEDYFSILEDCQMGFFLPGYDGKLRARERQSPKWIWHDPGVVRSIKGRLRPIADEEKGPLFESWLITTIKARQEISQDLYDEMYYWSPLEGETSEVDCLLSRDDSFCAIEIKSSTRFRPEMLKGLKAISKLPNLKEKILVYLGDRDLKTHDNIQILTLKSFLTKLHSGLFLQDEL